MRSLVRLRLLAATAFTLSACAQATGAGESARAFVQGDAAGLIAVDDRVEAPAVEGETLDGEWLRLEDLDGPVVINFWASWCGPCVEEEPHLVALSKEYAGRVHFVGVDIKDTRANAQAFVEQFEVPYPSWFDESASLAGAFGGIGPSALPTTIVLDSDHRIAAHLSGAVDRDRLSAAIRHALGTGA